VIDLGELYGATVTSEEPAPSWPRLLAVSGALWLSGRLLPVAERVRRRRTALAVLWVGEQMRGVRPAAADVAVMIGSPVKRWGSLRDQEAPPLSSDRCVARSGA
jgi:hypothetical protein